MSKKPLEPKIALNKYVPAPQLGDWAHWDRTKSQLSAIKRKMGEVASRQSLTCYFSNMPYLTVAEMVGALDATYPYKEFCNFDLQGQCGDRLVEYFGVDCCGQAIRYIELMDDPDIKQHLAVIAGRKNSEADGVHFDHGIPALKLRITDDSNSLIILLVDIGQFGDQVVELKPDDTKVKNSGPKSYWFQWKSDGVKLINYYSSDSQILFGFDATKKISNVLNMVSKKLIVLARSKLIQSRYSNGDSHFFLLMALKDNNVQVIFYYGNDTYIKTPQGKKEWTADEFEQAALLWLSKPSNSPPASLFEFAMNTIERWMGITAFVDMQYTLNCLKRLPLFKLHEK
eukprot:CAMPEP_0177675732 /NCGR_PEP_ID=MMETSP0447-20121125/27368_1 /TAXON_ID=0 /ORGANISM="Stygamoeba regulata, Strain BSH-02190019" /LENGTH=341 /DNA_ID=CAMNT_0019184159 /DNA_START=79 /DNA_END=1104 /DNA_ORIENTATION=+